MSQYETSLNSWTFVHALTGVLTLARRYGNPLQAFLDLFYPNTPLPKSGGECSIGTPSSTATTSTSPSSNVNFAAMRAAKVADQINPQLASYWFTTRWLTARQHRTPVAPKT